MERAPKRSAATPKRHNGVELDCRHWTLPTHPAVAGVDASHWFTNQSREEDESERVDTNRRRSL